MASKSRTPWAYHRAYCDGHKNSLGFWVADGRSARADTELVKRLELIKIQRSRKAVWKDTPDKTRQTIRLDVGAKDDAKELAKNAPSETHLFKALERTLELKIDAIIERVMENLLVGEKVVIWCLTRPSVEIVTDELERAIESRDVISRTRELQTRIWATHGEADIKVRTDLATAVRRHPGAGALIATMDSMPESISLGPWTDYINGQEVEQEGVTTEHYAQLHYLPGPMFQSENRPYLKNTSKLHIIYYIAKGTADERIEHLVLPRIETLEKLAGEQDATALLGTLEKKEETLKELWARLLDPMPDDGSADLGDSDAEVDD